MNKKLSQPAVRVLLLGAGAVSKIFYVPGFRRGIHWMELVAVVDPSGEALQGLGDLPVGSRRIQQDFVTALEDEALVDKIDAVIVALPHALHLGAVLKAIAAGLHVFCEKPLGLSGEEVEQMVVAANKHDRLLAVCQPRRSFPAARAIRQIIAEKRLGEVVRVVWEEGQPYAWPAHSLSQLRAQDGGGELFDIGAHVFDLLCWWLGPMQVTGYQDDGRGGTAAEYTVALKNDTGIEAQVHFSRLFLLKNQVEIICKRGIIRWQLKEADRFSLAAKEVLGLAKAEVTVPGQDEPTLICDSVLFQLAQFGCAVQNKNIAPVVKGEEALEYARIFDACRNHADSQQYSRIHVQSQDHYVVTGAAGFIGCHIVEQLLNRGERVTALMRSPQSAVRLLRNDVEVQQCDVTKPASMAPWVKRNSIIIHCAVSHAGTEVWPTTVQGALNVLQVAQERGARRVVLFSSMLAYGDPPGSGVVSEDSTAGSSEMEYARAKTQMERKCLEFVRNRDLEVVILQPTCVFGPFGSDFGTVHLDAMLRNEFFLVNQGSGLANLVYVDNLVDAALLAAVKPGVDGRRYIVNEEENAFTWRDYFSILSEGILCRKIEEFPSFSAQEIEAIIAAWQRQHGFPTVIRQAVRRDPAAREWLSGKKLFQLWKRVRTLYEGANRGKTAIHSSVLPENSQVCEKPSPKEHLWRHFCDQNKLYLNRSYAAFFDSQALFSSERIRDELGWQPRVKRSDALTAMRDWCRQAYKHRMESEGL